MIDFPNSPTVGQVVSSPNGTAWRWTGSTWVLGTAASAGGARGTVAYAQITASQPTTTTLTDIAGLSVTFTAVAGRTYKVTSAATLAITTGSTPAAASTRIFLDGAQVQNCLISIPDASGNPYRADSEYVTSSLTAGSHTFKVQANTLNVGTAGFLLASPLYPAFILVEDITFEQPSTGGGGGGGSGYTFVSDTKPTAANIGDTWFNSSTGASGGVSYVAIEEAPGGEKVWVQTSPGAGAIPTIPPKITEFEYTPGAGQTGNQTYTITTSMPTASMTGRASITAATALLPNTGTMAMAVLMFPLSAPAFGLGSPQFQVRAETPTITSGTWYTPVPLTAWSPITAGVKPGLQFQVFAGNLTVQWYVQFRITVVEYAT